MQNALDLPVFPIFFFAATSPEYRKICRKMYFSSHHTANAIPGFRNSSLAFKMHGFYSRIRKNLMQIPIQEMQAITMDR